LDEFSLIYQYFVSEQSESDVSLGIGDDTAILDINPGQELLVTTDTLIRGIHFPENTPPAAIAHKALAVNLSDIAAMGGTARWYTLALTMPDADSEWLEVFARSLHDLADRYSVSLIGGDTTRGDMSITITLLGSVPRGRAVTRAGAQPGDAIMITGIPGLASIGLSCLQNRIQLSTSDRSACLQKLEYPEPRLREGIVLRDYATAMIDVSDGVSADLSHILATGSCGAILDEQALLNPISNHIDFAENRILLDAVLHGGDDYELLFTVPGDRLEELNDHWQGTFAPVQRVGEITSETGIRLNTADANKVLIKARGYRHFQ
jgi:thiamine-monophosphate kinase